MSKIAVIMSVYKNDKLSYLKEALESLYIQTECADIFLQQDGKISNELEDFLDKELVDKRITYLGKRNNNIGLAGSLNELLLIVLPSYEYIIRMDADDISLSYRIQKQVEFLENHKNIQAVGGWIEEFNMDTNKNQVVTYSELDKEITNSLLRRNPMAHVTVCFRNTFFDIIHSYNDKKLNEDFDLWIRALKKSIKLHNLQEVLVKVRTSNSFFARRKNINRAIEVMELKIDATKNFRFGIKGYIYAVAHFLLFMSPRWLKSYIYKNLRG